MALFAVATSRSGLHVEEEVVERPVLARLGTRLLLRVDIASLEGERHLIGRPILSLANVDSHGVDRLGDPNLELLTVVLDRNRLAARLVHADIAKGDLGGIESRDRDDRRGRHCGVI